MLLYLISPFLIFSFYTLAEKISLKLFNVENIFNVFFSSILILTFLYLLSSYSIILNYNIKNFLIIISLLYIVFCIRNYKNIISNFIFFFKEIYKNYLLLLLFACYFFLIFFPAFDEDSLRYHLPIAKRILNQNFFDYHWFDYLTIGTSEFLNAIFLFFNFEYTSSLLNFTYLIFSFFIINYFCKIKKNFNKNNFLIFLSSPFLISLLTSQKFYIIPVSISVISLLYVFLNKEKLILKHILIISLSVIFMFITKPNFGTYLFLFFLLSFFYFKKKSDKLYFTIFFILFFFILYFPIIYLKISIYKDPLLPLLNLNLENKAWFDEYKFWLTSKQMDISDSFGNIFFKIVVIPFKLILPLTYSDILKSLGIGICFLATVNYKNKFIIFLTLFMFFNVFVFLNFQSRWFLPLLLFLCFVANINRINFLKQILYLQSIGVIIIVFSLSVHTVLFNLKIIKEKSFFSIYQDFYIITKYINNNYPNKEIFTNFNNWYRINNSKPVYYPRIMIKLDSNFYKKNHKKNDLVLWRDKGWDSDNLSVTEFFSNYLNCNKYNHVKTFYYRNSRNFFRKNIDIVTLYQSKCD